MISFSRNIPTLECQTLQLCKEATIGSSEQLLTYCWVHSKRCMGPHLFSKQTSAIARI
jgi:hypothetical protein